MKNYVFIAAAAAGLLMAAPAQAGDAAAGAKVFKKCKACHYVDREKNKSGPHLVNIIGRAAGAVDGFKYSKAMAGSGLVWDEATLAGFLAKPKEIPKRHQNVVCWPEKRIRHCQCDCLFKITKIA